VVSGGCGDDHGVGLVEHPGIDHVDLPAGHLSAVVAVLAGAAAVGIAGGPPSVCRVMLSMCRMGAPQNGLRQAWSRSLVRSASERSKQRRFAHNRARPPFYLRGSGEEAAAPFASPGALTCHRQYGQALTKMEQMFDHRREILKASCPFGYLATLSRPSRASKEFVRSAFFSR
jgi:hypothetical protein